MSSQKLILDSGAPNDVPDLCSGCSDEITRKTYRKTPWHRAQSSWRNLSPIHLVLHILSILLVVGLSVSLARRPISCNRAQSVYSPILDVLDDNLQTWRFNGSFKNDSPYKGPPSPAVDKAWADLWDYGATRITPSHLRQMGGNPIAAQFPPEAGGGYLGFVEVHHQIHCVMILWQHVYKDYYSSRSEIFQDTEETLLLHLNHCADLLRQKIMCDADVGMVPMYWVKKHDHPYPDWSTYHKCRDFHAVTKWVQENQVDMGKGWKGYMEKPEGAVELEKPP